MLVFLRQLTDGDALLRLQGGTPALVDKLIEGINIQSGAAITRVHQQEDGVIVENSEGQSQTFDRVVIATPTTKVQDFLDNQQLQKILNY